MKIIDSPPVIAASVHHLRLASVIRIRDATLTRDEPWQQVPRVTLSPVSSRALNDPELVLAEYSDESRFVVRRQAWTQLREDGEDAEQIVIDTVRDLAPGRALEVGSGTGEFTAALHAALPELDLNAVDVTPRMVELTSRRGVPAQVADMASLPFADDSFDAVIANRMLYHVPDIDQALVEVRRVLRDGGALVALTLAALGLPELWTLVGATQSPGLKQFSRENGEEVLRRHFPQVTRRDSTSTLLFPDRDAVVRYISAAPTRKHLAEKVPEFDGPFRTRLLHTLFVAS
jgi:SAM-dependent methyltransferase